MNTAASKIGRRAFLGGCVGTMAALSVPAWAQAPAAPSNVAVRSGKRVLQQSDFSYLGYYELDLGGEFSYGQGLTHRYVNGQLRFLALAHATASPYYRLREVLPPSALGARVSAVNDGWTDIWAGKHGTANGRFFGLWWDDATQKLWSSSAIDYPNDEQMMRTGALTATSLAPGGVVGPVGGLWGLEGISARRIYGGLVRIPTWFQQEYGVPPLGVGFGGYTSRMSQGLTPSLGPVLIAIPDPSLLPEDSNVPSGSFRVLMDHSSGNSGVDWYRTTGATEPTSYDRGVRTGDYTSFYDGGVYPTAPGYWQTAPDGRGRWVWGDSAYQTGVWIDLPDKHGFVLIPTVHTGNVWYQDSTLNWQQKTAEFQVFDPAQFGEVARGLRPPWNVKPTSVWRPEWQATPRSNGQGNAPSYTACAATFDSLTGRLYVRWTFATGSWPNTKDRIFVWQVG